MKLKKIKIIYLTELKIATDTGAFATADQSQICD